MKGLLKLQDIKNQTAFNLERWDELCGDERPAKPDWRIETDRHGCVITNSPAEYSHGGKQGDIVTLLNRFLSQGQACRDFGRIEALPANARPPSGLTGSCMTACRGGQAGGLWSCFLFSG